MEIPQITPPQKTSFWDFWHKKIYANRREKLIDFIAGLVFTPAVWWFSGFCLIMFSSIFAPLVSGLHSFLKIFGYRGGDTAFIMILLLFLFILLYAGFKRKYFLFGMLVGWFVFNFLSNSFMTAFH